MPRDIEPMAKRDHFSLPVDALGLAADGRWVMDNVLSFQRPNFVA
jgi:hypothetical protein